MVFQSQEKIVPVEIVGMPCVDASAESDVLEVPLPSEVNIPLVMAIDSVVVSLSNGIQISKIILSDGGGSNSSRHYIFKQESLHITYSAYLHA